MLSERIKTDILVVGSGPAGSTTAIYGAKSGASVIIIDKRMEIGTPVRCGEFIPSIEEIKMMFPNFDDTDSLFDIPSNLHCLDTYGIKIIDPYGKVTLLDHTGYTIDRDRFDKYLAYRAKEEGAQIINNCQFMEIKNGVASTTRGQIEYKVIVGADGPGSRVAKSLGLNGNKNMYPAATAQVKGNFEPYVHMYFGDVAPGAYGWIIPKNGCANIGIGVSPKLKDRALSKYFDEFISNHNLNEYSKLKGKYVPSEGPICKTVIKNGLVVGDAAGQVISVNGGGIPLAMIAGHICGTVVGRNISGIGSLDDYEHGWRRILEKPLKTAAFNKKLADIFAFRSNWSTSACIRILGSRRLGNLIRCKGIFP